MVQHVFLLLLAVSIDCSPVCPHWLNQQFCKADGTSARVGNITGFIRTSSSHTCSYPNDPFGIANATSSWSKENGSDTSPHGVGTIKVYSMVDEKTVVSDPVAALCGQCQLLAPMSWINAFWVQVFCFETERYIHAVTVQYNSSFYDEHNQTRIKPCDPSYIIPPATDCPKSINHTDYPPDCPRYAKFAKQPKEPKHDGYFDDDSAPGAEDDRFEDHGGRDRCQFHRNGSFDYTGPFRAPRPGGLCCSEQEPKRECSVHCWRSSKCCQYVTGPEIVTAKQVRWMLKV